MNNSLTHFLLPSTTLDFVILGLLLFCVSIGLLAAAKAKGSIQEKIFASHFRNIKSSVSELSAALRHPVWDHIVENTPGFALIIGLLGTFLGIGLAIQGAGEILSQMNNNTAGAADMRHTVGQLSPMLAEIGLKFKSSAWGILAHIFLRVTIPFFGIEEQRFKEIFKELEKDAREEQDAKNQRWDEMENLLRKALFTNTAQAGSIAKVLESQGSHLKIIADVQQNFGKSVEVLGSSIKEFEKTVDAFRGSMKTSLDEMKSTVTEATQGLHQTVESMKNEVNQTFSDFRDNVSQTLANVGNSISSSSTAIKDSVDVLSESMKSELQNVTNVSAALASHSREMASAISEQRTTLEELGNRVETISSKGAEYGFSLSDVSNHIQKLTGSDGAMIKHLKEISDHTSGSKSHLEIISKSSRSK